MHPYDKRFAQIPDADWNVVDLCRELAGEHGCEPAQIACAWLLSRKAVASVLGGANSVKQMDSYIGAADVKLPADEVARLDEAADRGESGPWKPHLAV